MTITILHIDDCPNWQMAGQRVREALEALGRGEVSVEFVCLTTSAEAATVQFAGSPTILLDGDDLFSSAGSTADLACRVYRTESGLAGLPSVAQVVDALHARLE